MAAVTTRASSCGCQDGGSRAAGGMTGRLTTFPTRNFWPLHDLAPRTDFISERNRTSLMWRL